MQNFYSLRASCLSLFMCIAILSFPGQGYAQCDPPAQLPTQTCQDAPLTCLQDACYSTQSWPPNGEPAEWCGPNTAVHNPQYFLFQATSTNVQINIHVNSCVGGGCGLQAAIIDTCMNGVPPWQVGDVLSCDPGQGVGGTMILTIGNAVIGQQYWLMIDGCSGQICEYTIEFVAGILSLDIPTELTDAGTNDPVVCQGQDEWTAWALNLIPEAHGYLWTGFPWAPGYHTTTYPDFSGPNDPLTIPDNAPPGVYEICVVAFSGCDTSDVPQCFDLEIIEIDDGYAPPVTLCPEEFVGVTWQGIPITGPGIYTVQLETPEGCPFDSIKEYLEFPEPEEGQIDTVVCQEFFIYEGVEYNNAGNYDLFYDNASIYGCDSTAVLNLDLIFLEVETDFFCEFGQFVLTSQVILAIPGTSGIQYAWYHNGSLISEDASFSHTEEGEYELFVSYEINGVVCTFPATTNPLVITLDDLVPAAPELNPYSPTACALDYPVYSVVVEDDILYYEWTADPSGVPLFVLGNLDDQVEVNWGGFSGGTICVNAVNHCGPGPQTCFDIMVIPSPLADFNMPPEACADSSVTIQFTGTSSPTTEFIWNFGGGTVQSGGTGIGPHVVAWGAPGFYTVSLQVAEEGCDTSDITYDIFIESLGTPVVSCNSTLSSVTFEWSPVNGAGSYQVNVLQGPSGMIVDDTTYVVTGLAPGTTVQIEVIAIGVGACPTTTVTAQCIAQSCPPIMLAIQVPQDTFCTGDVSGTIPLSATVAGNPVTGTWSGPGVDPAGTFDPNHPMAGPGVHTIVFMYSEGTCDYQRSRDVTVIESPTADFMVDAAICQADAASVQYMGNGSVNATYTWDFGSGVASGSGSGPYNVTWGAPGMYPISLTVEEKGCVSEVITHMVDVQPVLTAPSIQCFPTTSSVAIQWGMVPNATAYDVTHLFGQMGTVNGNRYEVTGLMPGDSVAIEITVSGNTICPPVTIVASCVARNCPMPSITVDPVDDICLYAGTGSVDLNVEVMTSGSGSGSWSGNGVVDVNQGIFDPNVAGPGSHMIDYNYMEDGCSFVESITIDVFDPPTAVISNTDFTLTCDNGNQLVLDGSSSTGSGNLSYSWTTDGVIIGATDQPTVTAGGEGDYTLTVLDLVSMCEDQVTVSLMQDDGVPDADAGPDGKIDCNIEFVVLGGNSSSGPGIQYQWSSTDGGTIDSDPTAPTITVSEGGTYELLVTDTNNGCTAVDQASVAMDVQQPTGSLAVGDILDCDTESTNVTATIAPGGSTYTYQWTTANGQILAGNGTSEITAGRQGTYTLIVTSQVNGCMDTISIDVQADPEVIQGIEAIVDNPNCVGDNDGMIEIVQVIGGTGPYTYAWSNQTSGSGLLFLAPGTYSVTITDANGCVYSESYVLPAPQPINPEIGPDIRVNITETVSITLTVSDPGSISDVTWSGPLPTCPGCFENTFEAEMSGDVVVTVVDTNGCVDSVGLRLTVYRPRNVYIPTIFSPNDDGINDRFFISGNTIMEIRNMRIYDRWGALVFEQLQATPNDNEGWDGTWDGKKLNPGVYVYVAELVHDDDRMFTEIISGDITLIR